MENNYKEMTDDELWDIIDNGMEGVAREAERELRSRIIT
jgi:hypothetical protein